MFIEHLLWVTYNVGLEKEVVTTPVLLPAKIPRMEEPGRLQSMGSKRVRHGWATSLSFYSCFWSGKWQPTLVFLPGASHGQRGLVGYSLWGCKESDTTKQLIHTHTHTHTHTHKMWDHGKEKFSNRAFFFNFWNVSTYLSLWALTTNPIAIL